MKIPKEINILGHDYKVQWVNHNKMHDGRLAECEWPTRIIRMSNELKQNKEWAMICFLHECWHGKQFESGEGQILEMQAIELAADSFASFVMSLKKQKVI